jgi:hypothetical protein
MFIKIFNNRSLRCVTKGFVMVRDLHSSGMLHVRNIQTCADLKSSLNSILTKINSVVAINYVGQVRE